MDRDRCFVAAGQGAVDIEDIGYNPWRSMEIMR